MKKLFFALLVSSFCICNAQEKISYADFIQIDTAVKWAAVCNFYINLTPANPNFNIRNYYFDKLKNGTVKAYDEDSSYLKVTPVYTGYADVLNRIKYSGYDGGKMMNWVFNYDNGRNGFEKIFTDDANNCDTCLRKNKLSFFKVKQLLYYKNNQLNIKNIFLSPITYKKVTGSGKEETVFAEWTNVAFDKGSSKIAIPSSAIFIGRAANNLILLPSSDDAVNAAKILTLNDWNLASRLFDDAKKGRIKFYDTEKSIYPTPKSILRKDTIENYRNPLLEVAIYDSAGEVSYRKIRLQLVLDSLYNYLLVQDFYFDFKNEKLYSKLITFVTRKNVTTSSGINLGLADHWGVIFPGKKKRISK